MPSVPFLWRFTLLVLLIAIQDSGQFKTRSPYKPGYPIRRFSYRLDIMTTQTTSLAHYSVTPRARNHKGNAPTLPKTKQCTMCPAQFTRTTHLNRHIRSHTNDRCYRCLVCGSEFTRSDLLARHRKTCREANGIPRSRRRSCQSCVKSKVKCDLSQPCSRCASQGKNCIYINDPNESRQRNAASSYPAIQSSAFVSHTLQCSHSSCPTGYSHSLNVHEASPITSYASSPHFPQYDWATPESNLTSSLSQPTSPLSPDEGGPNLDLFSGQVLSSSSSATNIPVESYSSQTQPQSPLPLQWHESHWLQIQTLRANTLENADSFPVSCQWSIAQPENVIQPSESFVDELVSENPTSGLYDQTASAIHQWQSSNSPNSYEQLALLPISPRSANRMGMESSLSNQPRWYGVAYTSFSPGHQYQVRT